MIRTFVIEDEKMNNSDSTSTLELSGKLGGFNIHDMRVLKYIRNWLEETPEDSWDIWHTGNI